MVKRSISVIDYSKEGFKVKIQSEGIKTYAYVNPEFSHEEEGLKPTDDYFIYLLHPKYGSCHFNLERNKKNQWTAVHAPKWLEKKIIKAITDEIPT